MVPPGRHGYQSAAPSFYDGVRVAQTQTIPKLSAQDKKRLLILTQLTDLVVPMHLMYIDGVRHYRSFALGHTGGFAAHFFADRDLIADFARTQQG